MTLPTGCRPGRGYADPAYAASLSEWGRALPLPHSGAVVLLVPIGGGDRVEAVAPYPLLSCPRPEGLVDDLQVLADAGAVTLTAVVDPMRPLPSEAHARFDLVRPFKRHFVTLLGPDPAFPSHHHRRALARAASRTSIDLMSGADADLDDWWALWNRFAHSIGLSGMRAGSQEAFARQFVLDGVMFVEARIGRTLVAAQVVLVTPDVAHAHLGVSDAAGRAASAMYAVDAATLESVHGTVAAVHWGGTAGPADLDDGLAAYKQGWSNAVREAWLVGAVLDRSAHAALGGRFPVDPAEWFPVWRDPRRTSGPPP